MYIYIHTTVHSLFEINLMNKTFSCKIIIVVETSLMMEGSREIEQIL